MKISKLFHWLYFSVMMLPIFILPIFALAVRSDNNFQPIEVQAQEYQVVNFNQYVVSDVGENIEGEVYYSKIDGYEHNIYFESAQTSVWPRLTIVSGLQHPQLYGHKCFWRFKGDNYTNIGSRYRELNDDTTKYIANWNQIFTFGEWQYVDLYTSFLNSAQNTYSATFYINFIDLTQMFGAGNEPTIEQFNAWYPDNYYEYNTGTKQLLNVGVLTYNDTDVGSQMVYLMYHGVDKYFNFDNAFNFGDLYTWLNVNFFNCAAPLGFFIFWHLLIYWLLISLFWLLFDVLIYVPMLIHRWLDKASLS